MLKMLSCCLNWKVIGTLAVAALAVWLIAPTLVAGLVPVLLVLVCPLSMLMMMMPVMKGQPGMKDHHSRQSGQPEQANCRTTPLPARLGQLPKANLSREEGLTELKAQLANSQLQQEAMEREIAQLESEGNNTAQGQAEAVVRASRDKQISHRN